MKLLRSSLGLLVFGSVNAARPVVPAKKKIHRDGFPSLASRRSLSMRGGDLGPINSKSLAYTLSALGAGDTFFGILAPISSMKWFGVDIDSGSLSEHYLHGIGASAATCAISTFLATSGKTSVDEAIGYGFLARLASMTIMILTNKYHELGMNNAMFGSMWLALAATAYALFSGNWEPKLLTKFLSLLLGFHGVFLYLRPEMFMKRATGKDKEDPLAKGMASIDGGYMMVAAMITGFLANGVDPEKVCGYASVAFMPVVGKLLDVAQVEMLGIPTEWWIAMVVAILSAITVGTLFDA